MAEITSRDRMLTALDCGAPDRVPCCFSAFSALRERCADQREFVEHQLEMGLDVAVGVGTPGPAQHPDVATREWVEDDPAEAYPVLHKEYATPGGTLHTEVLKSEDWPHGDSVPLLDDFAIARMRKPLVTSLADLDALPYLLCDSGGDALGERARQARALADEFGLITMAHYSMVGDVACWLAGMEPLVMRQYDDPEFVHGLLAVIEEWNRRQVALTLAQGVDVLVRRAWYEHADLWAPAQFERFILPGLRRDVEQVHAAGAGFGYLMSCGSMPLVDMMMDASVDVLLGVDPVQDRTMDLAELKRKAAGRMCLWGGVCGYLSVECAPEDEIRRQVREALATLGPDGFILAPVTNVRADTPTARRNVAALVDEWRRVRETS